MLLVKVQTMNTHSLKHRRTQIKICGFTRPADAVKAAELGVDSLGLVFYPPSSRHVSVEQAADIVAAVPPFTAFTALFLNADADTVEQVLSRVPVSLLQFHGTETAEFCRSFDRPYIKSVPMKSVIDVNDYCASYSHARGFLLDSNAAGAAGGSGTTFDWSTVPADFSYPLILAGGLTIENVGSAIKALRPLAVDLSSAVESAKGEKDHTLMQQFVDAVCATDNELNTTGDNLQR